MRIFWSIIALIAIVTLVLVWRGGEEPDVMSITPPVAFPDAPAVERDRDDPELDDIDEQPTEAALAEGDQSDAPPSDDAAAELAEELLASAEERRDTEVPGSLTGMASRDALFAQAAPAPNVENATPLSEEEVSELVAPSLDKWPMESVEPVSIARLEDGSLVLDDRFVVRGSGSEDDPYRITWDLLVSAAETYNPRQGRTKLPQRVTMFHGRHVVVTGYLAFPKVSSQVTEMLAMMNQWDGCCIGAPPSPYDAIEVRLETPTTVPLGHFASYGTVRGVLEVDPYLIQDWLVGLYLMENGGAEVEL